MGYYPIFVELNKRGCVVVGGGVVAERKAAALLDAGANVTVVSPGLTPRLDAWAREGRLHHVARKYRSGDLKGCQLAFVATGDQRVNEAAACEGKKERVWVNSADDPVHCDFILPSTLRRGEVVIAVSTGGASPAVARAIREELESHFNTEYGEMARIAAEVRSELKERSQTASPEAWRAALSGGFLELLAQGKRDQAKSLLRTRLRAAS